MLRSFPFHTNLNINNKVYFKIQDSYLLAFHNPISYILIVARRYDSWWRRFQARSLFSLFLFIMWRPGFGVTSFHHEGHNLELPGPFSFIHIVGQEVLMKVMSQWWVHKTTRLDTPEGWLSFYFLCFHLLAVSNPVFGLIMEKFLY